MGLLGENILIRKSSSHAAKWRLRVPELPIRARGDQLVVQSNGQRRPGPSPIYPRRLIPPMLSRNATGIDGSGNFLASLPKNALEKCFMGKTIRHIVCFMLAGLMVMATAGMGQWHPDAYGRHPDAHQAEPSAMTQLSPTKTPIDPALAASFGACCACSDESACVVAASEPKPLPFRQTLAGQLPVGLAHVPPVSPPRI
jgi:hypothetical protein